MPGLLLRSLIPVGFMPMFGPRLSLGLMLCPAYAPLPPGLGGASPDHGRGDASSESAVGMSMGIGMGMGMGMDMPMDTPLDLSGAAKAGNVAHMAGRAPSDGSVPLAGHKSMPGNGWDQEHTLCPYTASATLAGPAATFSLTLADQPTITLTQLAPQIAYFQITARAQSARAPPVPV
jgi:hypothetical protein